jgi:hypothetical protein
MEQSLVFKEIRKSKRKSTNHWARFWPVNRSLLGPRDMPSLAWPSGSGRICRGAWPGAVARPRQRCWRHREQKGWWAAPICGGGRCRARRAVVAVEASLVATELGRGRRSDMRWRWGPAWEAMGGVSPCTRRREKNETKRGGELAGDLRRGANRGGAGARCGQENGEDGGGGGLIAEEAREGLEEMACVA